MRLVVDANVLFSFFRDSPTRKLIISGQLGLATPEYVFLELERYAGRISSKAGISPAQFLEAVAAIRELADVADETLLMPHMEEAKRVCPDPKDVPYFACALAFSCPIWSNDKKLKRQAAVAVYSTSELLEMLRA